MAIDTNYYRNLIDLDGEAFVIKNDDVLEILDELDEMHRKYDELRDTSVSAKLILSDEEFEQHIYRLAEKRFMSMNSSCEDCDNGDCNGKHQP